MPEINAHNAGDVAKEIRGRAAGDIGPSTVRKSASVVKLAFALAKAQAEMKNPPKDSVNPHFKSRYADLATVRDTVMPVLNRHGLSVLQLPCECDGQPALTTIVMHETGEWVETTIQLHGKSDPQGIGSALTYMRRYTLQAVAGVAADEDDDGNAASRPQQQPRRETRSLPDLCAEAIDNAGDREYLEGVYRQYKADQKDGKFTPTEATTLDAKFKAKAATFPKPAPAKA